MDRPRRPVDALPGHFYRAATNSPRVPEHSRVPSRAASPDGPLSPRSFTKAAQKGRLLFCVQLPTLGRSNKACFIPVTSLGDTHAEDKFPALSEQSAFLPIGRTKPHLHGKLFATVNTSKPEYFRQPSYLDCQDQYLLDLFDDVAQLNFEIFVSPQDLTRVQELTSMIRSAGIVPPLYKPQQVPDMQDPGAFPPLGGPPPTSSHRGYGPVGGSGAPRSADICGGGRSDRHGQLEGVLEQDVGDYDDLDGSDWTQGFAAQLLLRSEA